MRAQPAKPTLRRRERRGPCPSPPYGDWSIDPFQRGGFALLDRCRLGSGALIAQELARQALLANDGVWVGRLPTPCADVGKAVLGAAEAEIRRLLARLAGPGLFDGLTGLLVGTLLLRPRRAGLRRSQVEIGRHRQRGARFDRELVGRRPLKPDRPLEVGAARSY